MHDNVYDPVLRHFIGNAINQPVKIIRQLVVQAKHCIPFPGRTVSIHKLLRDQVSCIINHDRFRPLLAFDSRLDLSIVSAHVSCKFSLEGQRLV